MSWNKKLSARGELSHLEKEKTALIQPAEWGLWNIYALVYDRIMQRSIPYKQLIQEVCESCRLPNDGCLLDAGCGTGNFMEGMKRKPLLHLVGLDSSTAMLTRAWKKLRGCSSVSLQLGDLNRPLPFADESFDGVICINVLYSTKRPEFTLAQLGKVLKKGGRLVLVTPPAKPRMRPIFTKQASALREIYPRGWPAVFALDLLRLLPYMPLFLGINQFIKRHENFYFFEREELITLAQAAGFQIQHLEKTYAGQGWLLVGDKFR